MIIDFCVCLFFVLVFLFLFYFFLKKRREKQFKERREKESLFDHLVEGIVIVDEKMKITQVNFIASRFLGFPKRHLLEKSFPEKEGSLLLEKSKELLLSCQKKETFLTEFITLETGKKIHLDLIAIPKISGGATLILQDKSSYHKVLEMGKDFIASASHELKTPITIIRGFAETLQDMQDLPKEIIADILEKIVRNCQRMDSLVKNLLILSDIENIPFPKCQYCDLESLMEDCKRMVVLLHPEADICIVKQTDTIAAEVEPSILELAFLNLLENAIKYSKAPAKVSVYMHQDLDEVVIAICDQGIGIPSMDLEHVFERFYTVNKAHSRKLGGAGLGLSIVKTIIEKHDGTIQVSSSLGEGSVFTIRLPLYQY